MSADIYKHIGEKIKELREHYKEDGKIGLSQEQLAGKIGVTPNTVSRWETATYKTKIEDLDKLAKFFSVPIYTFLPKEQQPDNPEVNALLSATADLTKSDIETLTDFALFRKTRSVLNNKKHS